MRSATAHQRARTPYWTIPVVRAAIGAVIGLALAFTPDHSSSTGLIYFGVFALASGLAVSVLSVFAIADRSTRTLFVIAGVVGIVCGVAALIGHSGGLAFYLYVVSIWAAVTGMLELLAGLRRRDAAPRRDWMVVGAATAVLAVVMLIIPDDSVLAVGLLDAYAIVLAVYLAIGGLSLKWATGAHPEVNHG